MGYIGEPGEIKRLNLEPLEVPGSEPVHEPVIEPAPAAEPAPVPA